VVVGLKRQLGKTWVAGVAGALLAVLAGVALHEFTFGSGLVNLSYDLLTVAKPQTLPTNVVLVVMDETSHEKLGQPLNAPWNRALHAQLVDRLTAAGAKAIVFDIVFSDPSSSAVDQKLARSLAQSKRVILAADPERVSNAQKRFKMPIDILRNAAAAVGSDEVVPGRDLIVRQHTPGQPIEVISTLSWVTAQFVGPGQAPNTNAEAIPRWIQYYAPANSLLSIKYEDALGNAPANFFQNKVVFVGARIFTRLGAERKDEYRTPFSSAKRTEPFISGVEIQATAFLNLARADWWERLPIRTERAIIVAVGVLIGFFVMQARPVSATALAIVIGVGLLSASYVAVYEKRLWFPWLIPAAQLALIWVLSVAVNSFRLYLERRLYEQTAALYLPPKLVKKFAQHERFRRRGAEKQMLTILFSDIANFTTISEGMDSDALARLMNNYFQKAVSECIHPTDGTVVKYIGDAIFAFWNAPDQQHDHAVRACETALRFRNQPVQEINGHPLLTRVGLHTGIANVGNFGSIDRFDYTALGENINLASRMEGLNKYLGTQVLLTDATQAEIGRTFATRFLGKFRLKGFEKTVGVYELLGTGSDETTPWLKVFQGALDAFAQQDFTLAKMRFSEVLSLQPDDGPSIFYLHKLEELRQVPPARSWSGEVELKEK
jgi:adenylate cyclase